MNKQKVTRFIYRLWKEWRVTIIKKQHTFSKRRTSRLYENRLKIQRISARQVERKVHIGDGRFGWTFSCGNEYPFN